ncbi:universal stress protein [Azohydromonas caseinilytica]|uniref:Universal stress protein n=1 Tax=Azohydromonas caseinilytica TaxID=2728836 RepID=A0A848FC47_9BURK|nr:universal stress protein [Azohydromonas caseinilytica]NML15760.1 universal stress protein [Azohydromonas caseinilytica]
MSTLGPILVATDFSAPARHAAQRGARIARETGSPLSLLHVLPGDALELLREWLGNDNAAEPQLLEQGRRQLLRLAQELQTAHQVPRIDSSARAGQVLHEILCEAEERQAGLLVLGARGAGFLRRLLVGTTADRLMRRTVRPLLVVRQTPHEPYRRVLVPVDFSPWSAHAVALAHRVAPHARLVLMTVYEVPFEDKLRFAGVEEATVAQYRQRSREQATQRLDALVLRTGLKAGQWEPCVLEGEASLRVVEQEQEQDCDLVVLGKHGRSLTEDMLLGSVTKHVLAEGSADLLISTAHEAVEPVAGTAPA